MTNPFYVQPANIMPGMQAAMGGIMAGAEAKQELQKGEQLKAKREELSNLFKSGAPDEVGEFFIKNPDLAKEFDVAKTAADKMTREEEVSKAWDIYTGKVDPAAGALEHAEEILKRGGNAAESIQLAEMAQKDPEIAKRAAAGVLARYDTEGYKAYRESQGMGAKPSTPATDLDDFTRDAIEQYALDNNGEMMPPGERNQARKEFKRAQAKEQRETSRAVEGVKTSSMYAKKFFEKANDVNTALYNIDDAIEALKSGAMTGPMARKLPSVRAATLKLENAQNRMGLDVVKDVTFGALSEKELDVAKQTAMPTGLQPDEMVNWLEEKRRITQIQLEWVQKAADHFAEGGGLAEWIRLNRANPATRRDQPQPAAPAEQQVAPVAAAPQQSAQPPVPGARLAPDGKWYVEQNGKFFKVEQ